MLVSLHTCRRHYPGGTIGPVSLVGLCRACDPMAAAFPIASLGRLPHQLFRGLLSVHSRYGLHARGAAKTALSVESFSRLVTRATVSTATGCNDYFPGGTHTR
jgi:hypothetical protein